MNDYISAKLVAKKWKVSYKKIIFLCEQNSINGAKKIDFEWFIPKCLDSNFIKNINEFSFDKNFVVKPFLKWAGGKTKLINEIELILKIYKNRINKYVEPMVGSGALFFYLVNKFNFKYIYISDTNKELINTYLVIKNNITKLINKLSYMKYSYLAMDDNKKYEYYYLIRNRFNKISLSQNSSVNKAAQFIFLNKTCFNGLYRVNKNGEFNVPMGRYKNPEIFNTLNLIKIHKILQNVIINCHDYSLCETFVDKNTFIYFDPPDRPLSKTSNFTAYNSNLFNDEEQLRLAQFINRLNLKCAKFVLSNSDPKNVNINDNFFDNLYKEFNIKRIKMPRVINCKGNKREYINEILVFN